MLPSYEQAQEIVAKNNNFYEKVVEIDGVKVSIFNYILSRYELFENPVPGSDLKAYELRGLTFVHNENGTKTRYLALKKFFNYNETPANHYDELSKKSISEITDKLDGSMVTFIRVKDKWYAKTKASIDNEQTAMANKLLEEDKQLQQFLETCWNWHHFPIFELISPANKIVLNYDKTELRLLQLRNRDGAYQTLKNSYKQTQSLPIIPLDSLLTMQQVVEESEGVVVRFEDGHMVKFKTVWYQQRHRLLENVVSENLLCEMILTDKLDDALSMLDANDVRRQYAEKLQTFLIDLIQLKNKKVMELLSTYNGSKKDFALANRDNPLFHVAIRNLDTKEPEKIYDAVKESLIHNTKKLEQAKIFIKESGFYTLAKSAEGNAING